MATTCRNVYNIKELYFYYKKSFGFTNETYFKLIDIINVITPGNISTFQMQFKIGINYLIIGCYEVNLNLQHLESIKTCEEFEALLTLDELTESEIIKQITHSYFSKDKDDFRKMIEGKIGG